jgi:hypothetical protein
MDLRLQEDDGELRGGVLDLLPAFNCGERQWKMHATMVARVLGILSLRDKIRMI